MLKWSLSKYSNAYILVKETVRVPNMADAAASVSNLNKKVIVKNCTPFIHCISEIENTQVDNVKDVDVVMSNKYWLFKKVWKFMAIL